MSPVLQVTNLVKHFELGGPQGGVVDTLMRLGHLFGGEGDGDLRPVVHAVDGIDFEIGEGETLGLVGESGCGKSTTGRCLLRLIEPTSGHVTFEGIDLLSLPPEQMRARRRDMQMVFQDPTASLNPRLAVKQVVAEPLRLFGNVSRRDVTDRVAEVLVRVGLRPDHMERYPHELSGGEKQRVGIARAIATHPKFIVLDEPTAALDVSIQSAILLLLVRLQKEMGVSYLFISHDLSTIKYLSDRVAVMYLGRIVEVNTSEELFRNPLHPYTQSLLSAVPVPDPTIRKTKKVLAGEPTSPINLPPGCRLSNRCPHVMPICREAEPPLVSHGGQLCVACYLFGDSTA